MSGGAISKQYIWCCWRYANGYLEVLEATSWYMEIPNLGIGAMQ